MNVERSDSDGQVRVTLTADEAPLLAAALQRAAYQDIPLDMQERTMDFAEDLFARLSDAIEEIGE